MLLPHRGTCSCTCNLGTALGPGVTRGTKERIRTKKKKEKKEKKKSVTMCGSLGASPTFTDHLVSQSRGYCRSSWCWDLAYTPSWLHSYVQSGQAADNEAAFGEPLARNAEHFLKIMRSVLAGSPLRFSPLSLVCFGLSDSHCRERLIAK